MDIPYIAPKHAKPRPSGVIGVKSPYLNQIEIIIIILKTKSKHFVPDCC
jgi:hypothetical protein